MDMTKNAWIWLILGLAVLFFGFVAIRWISSADWLPVAGLVGALAGLLCLLFSFGLAVNGSFLGVLRSGTNKYSLSRLQMVAWTWMILSALISLAVARLWHDPSKAVGALDVYIPANLLIVMGISFFTGAAAPAVLSLKGGTDNQPSASQLQAAQTRMSDPNLTAVGQIVVRDPKKPPKLVDLIQGDDVATAGTVDVSKVQQLLITMLVLGVYLAMLWDLFLSPDQLMHMPGDLQQDLVKQGSLLCGFANAAAALKANCGVNWASLPDFPASLVTLLAVSHGGYLAYKAAPRAAGQSG